MQTQMRTLILGLVGVGVASAGQAQFVWNQPIGAWQGNQMFNAQRVSESFAPSPNSTTRDKNKLNFQPSTSATDAGGDLRLDYQVSSARRKRNIAAFIKKSRTVDPAGAAAMEKLFASTDLMGMIEGEMRKVGFTSSNVADAYAVYWTNAWLATQGRNENLSRNQMQAVKRQAAVGFAAAPEFVGSSDAQKQEFAEALLIQAMLISASVDAAKEQPSMMTPLKAAVRKGAKESGLDLSTMTLTDEGFRPVRGSDASGAPIPVGDKPEALTSADETPKEGPNYLLLAAAGGAGFAGVYVLGKRAGRKG